MKEQDMASTNGTEQRTSETEDGGRLSGVRQSAAEAYETARERTRAAFATTRDSVRGAGRRTADGVDANPVAAVIGGLALGAVVGALLPRSRREQALFGGVGRRVNQTAREALSAARDAGRKELDEMGISREGLHRRLDEFTDRAVGAVRGGGGDAGKD
jgi:hypothetical protein